MTSIDQRMHEAQQKLATYQPNAKILHEISSKVLIATVGVAGVGKSTTLDKVAELDPEFGRTGSVMTRTPEPRDDPQFCRFVSKEAALEQIEQREFVNYIVHPTTNNIYATDLGMYSHTYNMLETLPGAVDYFRSLGFRAMHTLYVVTEPEVWQTRFDERYGEKTAERTKRLMEAEANLQWSLDQDEMVYVYNPAGRQEETAQKIINIVKYNQQTDNDYKSYAQQMLVRIQEMK